MGWEKMKNKEIKKNITKLSSFEERKTMKENGE